MRNSWIQSSSEAACRFRAQGFEPLFSSFGSLLRSGIAVSLFEAPSVPPQWPHFPIPTKAPEALSSRPRRHTLLSVFLVVSPSCGRAGVSLPSISSHAWWLGGCLVWRLFEAFAPFQLFCVCVWLSGSSLCVLGTEPSFAGIFSCPAGCLFTFLILSFEAQKVLVSMNPCSCVLLCSLCFSLFGGLEGLGPWRLRSSFSKTATRISRLGSRRSVL